MIPPHLPERFKESLTLYLKHGISPGSFLMAVLENNLMEAFAHADRISVYELPGIVSYLYNEVPRQTFGSPEACFAHIQAKALEREEKP